MNIKNKIKGFLRIIGPGFVSGAADNDPAGITTYTQAGSQFGYGQLWIALLIFPLLAATQDACARIGAVTGKGLATLIKENYGKKILYGTVILILIANTINIGADIGAMSAAANLIIPIPFAALMLIFTGIILFLEIFVTYKEYVKYLKWFAFATLSYLLAVFVVREPWKDVLYATFVPHLEFTFPFLLIIAGNIGSTITPYLFFWETSEEVEEDKARHLINESGKVNFTEERIKKVRLDNVFGMFISQLITWSIILVSASVLYKNGIRDIKSAADAALALEPLVNSFPYAGILAKAVFALGIVSAGLLVVPVLSSSAAYALSEALNWKEGLNLKLKRAHGFYGVITIATLVGLLVNMIGINPIKLLIYTSVLNGIFSIPLLFLVAKISGNQRIMGAHKNGKIVRILIIVTFFAVIASGIGLISTYFLK